LNLLEKIYSLIGTNAPLGILELLSFGVSDRIYFTVDLDTDDSDDENDIPIDAYLKIVGASGEHREKILRSRWIYKYSKFNWEEIILGEEDSITIEFEGDISLVINPLSKKYCFVNKKGLSKGYTPMLFGDIQIPSEVLIDKFIIETYSQQEN
jgi:hypothetical protein